MNFMGKYVFPGPDDIRSYEDRKETFEEMEGEADVIPGVMSNSKDIIKCIKDAYPDDPSILRGHSFVNFIVHNDANNPSQYTIVCELLEDGGDSGFSKFNVYRDAFVKFVHEYCPQYDEVFDPAKIKNITSGKFNEDSVIKRLSEIDRLRATLGMQALCHPYRKIN